MENNGETIKTYFDKNDIRHAFGLYRVNKKITDKNIEQAVEEGYDDQAGF